MNWSSRFVLARELDNTSEVGFRAGALMEGLERHRPPDISNTDKGSQFTSEAYVGFIGLLWRSLKYEAVYLEGLEGAHRARRVISRWQDNYNHRRPHIAPNGRTPAEVYSGDAESPTRRVAA